MFKKIVIASHNKGKVREIGELLAPLGLSVVSASEMGVDEPEETGLTFSENAILKAVNTANKTGLPALADDSGLCVEDLDGAPGIYSARWAGENKDFTVAFARIQKELSDKNILNANGVPAYFICALCLTLPNDETQIFEGRIDGVLTFPPRGEHGFGYDPIFIPDGYDITFAEMNSKEKHAISHRARAFKKLLEYLENNQ
ncbi:MAG: RdgB/HAM1 family non-canonical purine NTP pyrophosphatase [Pseudomonadota bacterium]